MDQLLRKISCFILTVIRSVSLNWSVGLARPVWTKPHNCSEAHQNGALPQRLFSPSWKRYLLLPFSTTLFNAFNAGWCSVRIVFNALHLPTNHKTIKTEKERNSETHYAFLSAVDLLQRTSSPLWTPLPPLWVSAFTGKTQITSHALWFVGGVILFSIGFSSICGFLWSVLCSMFVPFFFFFLCFPWHYKSRFLDPECKPLLYLDICVSLIFIFHVGMPNWLCTQTACWNASMSIEGSCRKNG